MLRHSILPHKHSGLKPHFKFFIGLAYGTFGGLRALSTNGKFSFLWKSHPRANQAK